MVSDRSQLQFITTVARAWIGTIQMYASWATLSKEPGIEMRGKRWHRVSLVVLKAGYDLNCFQDSSGENQYDWDHPVKTPRRRLHMEFRGCPFIAPHDSHFLSGNHLGHDYETPFREDQPRHMPPNFYYVRPAISHMKSCRLLLPHVIR